MLQSSYYFVLIRTNRCLITNCAATLSRIIYLSEESLKLPPEEVFDLMEKLGEG